MNDIHSEVGERAVELGSMLNLIVDDQERDKLFEHFKTVLTGELVAGEQNRKAAPLWVAVNQGSLRVVA